MDKYIDKLIEILKYGQKLIGRILILIIELRTIKMITKKVSKLIKKKYTAPFLASFIKGLNIPYPQMDIRVHNN